LALLCIIYPIIIYYATFEMTLYTKLILLLFLIFTVVLMVGNTVYSIIEIVNSFVSPSAFLHRP
jgi:hypothetical protein